MSLYEYPEWGKEYTFELPVIAVDDGSKFFKNPVVLAENATVAKDSGDPVQMTTTPVSGTNRYAFNVSLSAAEMQATNVEVHLTDPDGNWADVFANIQTRQPQEAYSGFSTNDSFTLDRIEDTNCGGVNDKWKGMIARRLDNMEERLIVGSDADGVTVRPGFSVEMSIIQPWSIMGNVSLDDDGIPHTIYVDPEGSDDFDGLSWASAKKTIEGAVAVASAGKTIELSNGTHIIATGVKVVVPSGVVIKGQGCFATKVVAEVGDIDAGAFQVAGINGFFDVEIFCLGAGGCIEVTSTESHVRIKDCLLHVDDGPSVLYRASSTSRSFVSIEDSRILFDGEDQIGVLCHGDDLCIRNTTFIGDDNALVLDNITSDASLILTGCDFFAEGGPGTLLYLQTAELKVMVVLEACRFNIEEGLALSTNTTGALGNFVIYDNGLCNLTDDLMELFGAVEFIQPWKVDVAKANLVQIGDAPITEYEDGDLAKAFSYFFDVPTPDKTVNDVGSDLTEPVRVDLVQALGIDLTETNAGDLAAAISHFFDVDTPEKTINDVGGSDLTEPIQADIVKILHTDLSENQLGAIAVALSYFFNVDTPKKNMNEVGSDLEEPVDANVVGWLGNAPEELIEIDDIWSDGNAVNTENGKILEVGTVTDGAKETAATVNKDAIIAHGGPGDWTTGSGATVTNINVSAPTQVATPSSGEEAVEVTITALCKAADGSPENVTSPSWVVEGFITGDRSADWKDVGENPDIGTYRRIYQVKSTAAIEDLVFKFAGEFADGTDRVGQASTILRDGDDTGAVVVGEMSLAALQQFVQDNTGLPVAATQSVADLSKGDGGSVTGSTYSPVLQHDVDSGFIFKMQRRSSGALGSTNAITIYLGETPRFGFDLAQVLKSKPRHILSLVVVPADSGLDVEVDDADTLGVRDYLAMSRFKNAAIAGNYVVQITVETFSGEAVTAEGTVVVKPVSSVSP